MSEHRIFVVKNSSGTVFWASARDTEIESQAAFIHGTKTNWSAWESAGYRCVPILAVERAG